MRDYSLEYFISHYDSGNEVIVKECIEQLDLGELQRLDTLVRFWRLDLKWYNCIDRLRAYNCLNTIEFLVDKRISYQLFKSPITGQVNRNKRLPFQLDER